MPRRVLRRGKLIGERVGGEPKSEAEHFIKCPECGGYVDMRDLGQVLEHEGAAAASGRGTGLKFLQVSCHDQHGGAGKLLRVKVVSTGQVQNEVRQIEAGFLYGVGAIVDTWSDLCPGVIKSLPESPHLVQIIWRVFDELAGFHWSPPPATSRTRAV